MRDWLTPLAWLNVILHVVALALAALGMRPGTPAVELVDRLNYLAQAPAGWTVGWASWMLCAVALIAFLAALLHRLAEDAYLARVGLMVAIAGAAFDLFCDSLYIVVFPAMAANPTTNPATFVLVERVTGIASMVIANGAYSVAILLFALALRRTASLASIVGYAVGLFGFLLCAAGFTGVPWHAEWATGPTIGLFCIWVVLVARALRPLELRAFEG